MKATKRETMTNDEKFDRFLLWTMAVSVFCLMLCVYVISPLAYVWTFGLAGCGLILVGGSISFFACLHSSPVGFLFAGDMLKLTFELVGLILKGLAGLSSSSN